MRCDQVGLRGAVIGIRPLFGMPKVIGRAVTIKITAAGMMKSKRHLGVDAIASAEPGDVIAIDNRGDIYNNCWGEILSCAAQKKGVSGVFVDGAARDIDFCQEIGFPVFARGVVPITARGGSCRRTSTVRSAWATSRSGRGTSWSGTSTGSW